MKLKTGIIGNRESKNELGHLAMEINAFLTQKSDFEMQVLGNNLGDAENLDFLIHMRRVQDSIQAAVDFCQKSGTTLINLSTGLDFELPKLEEMNFVFLNAPNIALRVIEFMLNLKDTRGKHKDWDVLLIEHHQEAKKSLPGTAAQMAETLFGTPEAEWKKIAPSKFASDGYFIRRDSNGNGILSVRNWSISQGEFNIPDEFESGFGIHEIRFSKNGEKSFSEIIKVFGRKEYAEGITQVLQCIPDLKESGELQNGVIGIQEFVRRGMHK